MAHLLSLLLQGNIFTKSQTIYKKAQILFWQLFTKAQIPFWQLFLKTQYYFGNYLQKPNIILAIIYKNSNTTKSPSTILGNILSKDQILVWQNFTNTQKPKYYSWQYFIKSPNNILEKFYKNPNTIESPNTILGNILQNSNTILATFYQRPKTITFLTNNYFIKAQILFGK